MASAQITPEASPPAKKRRPPPRAMPPPGVDDNEGEYVTEPHCGWCTACIYLAFWPVACCPIDRRRIYVTSRGVRYYRDGRKVPGSDGWQAPVGVLLGLLAMLLLCWVYAHKCSTFEICTDWCKSNAMFSIANDPSNSGAAFIHRWGDDVAGLKLAIESDGLFETLGAPSPGAAADAALPALPEIELESVDVQRVVDTESNVDVFVVTTLFQTEWGPPEQWFRALAANGWSVHATFSGELDLATCDQQRQRYLETDPPANGTAAAEAAAAAAAAEEGDDSLPFAPSVLELQVSPASRSWELQCDGERVHAWYDEATERALLGSPPPSQGKWPSYARGLCVFGSFMDGELQCTEIR
jgi:hypothetical protein